MTEHQTENQTEHQAGNQAGTAPPPPYQAPYQQPGQQPGQPPFKRLTRTSWDAPISGVCGGVARYLGVDPTLVRVLAAIAMVVTFPAGPIVYAVMWAVMPKE
jgi:phage shock protein C